MQRKAERIYTSPISNAPGVLRQELATSDRVRFVRPLPVCEYRGGSTLIDKKLHYQCLHPQKPIGEYVCACANRKLEQQCGPWCPGYQPDETEGDFNFCKRNAAAEPFGPHVAAHISFIRRFDQYNLPPFGRGLRLNASIVEASNGYWLISRDNWARSNLVAHHLDNQFEFTGRWHKIDNLITESCEYGREDPRAFRWGDGYGIFYSGVNYNQGLITTTPHLAKLDNDMRVEWTRPLANVRNGCYEKNWSPLVRGDNLYLIYRHYPYWRVLKWEPSGILNEVLFQSNVFSDWAGGDVRGGTPYVFFNGSYVSVVHDYLFDDSGRRCYRAQLMVVDPETLLPAIDRPLSILRAIDRTRPVDAYYSVVFPCGLVSKDGKLVVSLGGHDKWVELWEIDATKILHR